MWQPGAGAMIVKVKIGRSWPKFLHERISGDVEFILDAKEDPDAIMEIMREHVGCVPSR